MHAPSWRLLAALLAALPLEHSMGGENLIEDPSFEIPKEKDRFGLVFAKWGGWKYEGDCDFAVGRVARTGKHSCLLAGGAGAKIRVAQLVDIEPGRYEVTAYIRGLDIGTGTWNCMTEFMFDGKYVQLGKNGTFGWLTRRSSRRRPPSLRRVSTLITSASPSTQRTTGTAAATSAVSSTACCGTCSARAAPSSLCWPGSSSL